MRNAPVLVLRAVEEASDRSRGASAYPRDTIGVAPERESGVAHEDGVLGLELGMPQADARGVHVERQARQISCAVLVHANTNAGFAREFRPDRRIVDGGCHWRRRPYVSMIKDDAVLHAARRSEGRVRVPSTIRIWLTAAVVTAVAGVIVAGIAVQREVDSGLASARATNALAYDSVSRALREPGVDLRTLSAAGFADAVGLAAGDIEIAQVYLPDGTEVFASDPAAPSPLTPLAMPEAVLAGERLSRVVELGEPGEPGVDVGGRFIDVLRAGPASGEEWGPFTAANGEVIGVIRVVTSMSGVRDDAISASILFSLSAARGDGRCRDPDGLGGDGGVAPPRGRRRDRQRNVGQRYASVAGRRRQRLD